MSGAQAVSLSFEDGTRAVELAREAIESYVVNGKREQPGSMRDAFYQRTGAIVRIESTRGPGSLRGCAGTVEGRDQLGHAIVEAGIAAASDGSCGSELRGAELDSVTVSTCIVCERSVSTDPLNDLEVGVHGVAIDDGNGANDWLFPTVPKENGWSAAEYLERTCRKTGLAPTAWQDDDVTTTLFEGLIFREIEPAGAVELVE